MQLVCEFEEREIGWLAPCVRDGGILDVGSLHEPDRHPRIAETGRIGRAPLEVRLNGGGHRQASPRDGDDGLDDPIGARGLLGPDLDPRASRERLRDSPEPLARRMARLIDTDVREIQRQKCRRRSLVKRTSEPCVGFGDSVGLDRVGDAFAEEIDRAGKPVARQLVRDGESVGALTAGDVAACARIGGPLASGQPTHCALEALAGGERDQDAT
jgi:hypothetical protein